MSLNMPIKLRLRHGGYIGHPIMFLSLRGTMASSGATTIFSINLANGNASGSGTTRSGGARASNNLGRRHNYQLIKYMNQSI